MCMVDGNDDVCEIWRTKRIKAARKEHKCSECYRQIRLTEPYLYVFYIYDGHPENFHICQHCEVATAWLCHNCGGFLVQGVFEDIEQHCEGGFPLGLHRLRWGMANKWERKGALMPLPKYPADYPPPAPRKPLGDPVMA